IRLLGEALRTYIIVEWNGSVHFIDKHAAHERILYNELKQTAGHDAQILLAPLSVSVSREEYGALAEAIEQLKQAGFELEEFGGNTLLVRAVPMMLADGNIIESLREVAGGLLSGKREITTNRLDWIYHSVACRAAVKAGDGSTPQELTRLAERVLYNDDIRTCPHGRPVCFELTAKELEKQFGRIV
ncbi:MAG: DNA mismatch repair protein MutL, partial [Clostridia bacterium]|nr:DNA mismatch repair protein MutL [Clostridia bacterium]